MNGIIPLNYTMEVGSYRETGRKGDREDGHREGRGEREAVLGVRGERGC